MAAKREDTEGRSNVGRFVWIEDSIEHKGRGKKVSWSGLLAQKMRVGESVLLPDDESAGKVRESIRHYYGKSASKIKKHPYCGWRVWRTE